MHRQTASCPPPCGCGRGGERCKVNESIGGAMQLRTVTCQFCGYPYIEDEARPERACHRIACVRRAKNQKRSEPMQGKRVEWTRQILNPGEYSKTSDGRIPATREGNSMTTPKLVPVQFGGSRLKDSIGIAKELICVLCGVPIQLCHHVQPPPQRCPTCDSPKPHLHPAMQYEGEVQPCKDEWHKAAGEGPKEGE